MMYKISIFLFLFLWSCCLLKAQEPVKPTNKKNVSIEKKKEHKVEKDKESKTIAPENTKQTEVASQKRIVSDTAIVRERREAIQQRRQE